jgi:hypothetical protein
MRYVTAGAFAARLDAGAKATSIDRKNHRRIESVRLKPMMAVC